MNKILLPIAILILAACATKFEFEIFNNSGLQITYDNVERVALGEGAVGIIRVLTTTRKFQLVNSNGMYEYTISLNELPGKYFVPGIVHRIKLQIENDMRIYIQNPKDELPIASVDGVEQPKGFPLMPRSAR